MTRTFGIALVASAGLVLTACGDQATNVEEKAKDATSSVTTVTSAAPTSTEKAQPEISKEKAEDIALKDAGVPRDQVTEWDRSDFDTDDGRDSWEVEFNVGNDQFEYDIDAHSGEIISKDVEK
ncbi:PepSY domain-containing protein [Corynebacterium tapiri]|uniref:PepSY domain-containing protein n=1 Tax=Corynebacterium tapiri TaxID=1448266 RepID=A0A5C4U6D7_9CORY|nr:PepSY domain-containing protein [Corynebacterium tapiri]TNM00462.1 PepSY domain-containing protein [Corynebacterium tapiri]